MFLSPTPVQQFFDDNGDLLVGGQLFVYQGGTVSKQSAFTDDTGDTPLPNPIVLNSRGEVAPSAEGTSCGLWLDPTLTYKLVLAPATDTDPPTNAIWTIDNIVSPQSSILAALAQYEATLGGNPIGSIIPYGGATAPTGWLFCYGQAVSRTTYALLFAIIGTAFGVGNGTTTFNLPDLRGRYPLGKDNMGGSTASRVTNAVSGIVATTLGAVGGDQNAQSVTISASSGAVAAVTDPGHNHALGMYAVNTYNTAPLYPLGTTSATRDATYSAMDAGYTGIAVSVTVTTAATSTNVTGSSQNMPPVQVANYIIFTSV